LAKEQVAVDTATGEVIQTGRVWGVWRDLPTGESVELSMGRDAFVTLTRRLRRWGRHSHYLGRLTASWWGFLVLGDLDVLLRLMRGLDVDVVCPG